MFRIALSLVTLAGLLATPPLEAQGRTGQPSTTRASGRSAAKPAVSGTININTASATDLQALPGVGAKTAQRIVEYRQKNGPFKKVEDLMNVRGVGEKNFLKLKNQIGVGAAKADHTPNQH
jgi:comEA protein